MRVELATLADPAIGLMLTGRGYRLQGFENVLGMALPAAAGAGATSAQTPRVTRSDDDAAWGEISVDGFVHPDETSGHAEQFPRDIVEQIMNDMRGAAGFSRYLAWVEGEPAAAASLRLDDGIALLTGATTLPRFRRRGAQGALLARRLADAAAAGCELACITTAPGTRSQANAHRQGFGVLYARAVLTRGD